MSMPTETNNTVLIEAFWSGGRGSEAGGAEVWITAATSMASIRRVIVISSIDRQAITDKEIVHYLPVPRWFYEWYNWNRRLLGKLAVHVAPVTFFAGYIY